VKLGAENRTKLITAVALGAVALVLIGMRFVGSMSETSPRAASPATLRVSDPSTPSAQPVANPVRAAKGGRKTPAVQSLDPTLRVDLLANSEETKYEGAGRNIFRVFVEPPPPPIKSPVLDHKVADNTPPPPPPPPPINLRFYGFATSRPDGAKRIFLAQNEDVFIASEGDIVDRRYKVVRISPNAVEILDVLSNNRQSIPLTQG
jgi:hypothetical protein